MAIPKVIHYCWFGGNPLTEDVNKCIASWKKWCPNYEIIQWDESNYDYKKNKFAYQAYQCGKWAFVSDVARLDVVYHFGGIYLDTDVELIKPLDFLLSESAFMGFEKGRMVATGLGFGAEKGNELIGINLQAYDELSFFNVDGTLNMIPCPQITTKVLEQNGLERKDKLQMLNNMKVFPSSYFCPMILGDGSAEVKTETVSIHHYANTWGTEEKKRKESKRRSIYTKFGRLGLRCYDGITLLKERGMGAFLKRCGEILSER